MSFLLFDDRWLTLHARATRIAASDIPHVETALELLAECRALKQRVDAQCESQQAQARAAGRAEGFDQGWRDAAAMIEQRLATVENLVASERRQHATHVGALAMQIVRQLAAEFAPAETITALIKGAVTRLVHVPPVTISLHPSIASDVAARLASTDDVRVVVDEKLRPDQAEMRSGNSLIDVGLDAQLRAIEPSFDRMRAQLQSFEQHSAP